MVDINTIQFIVVLVGTGLYAGFSYALKKMQDSGTTFSLEKFLPTMGIGALASVVLYIGSGAIPGIENIFTSIDTMMPGGALSITVLLGAVMTIINQLTKGGAKPVVATAPVVAASPAGTSAASWSPGFTAVPAAQAGVSPYAALITATVGDDAKSVRCNLRVDFGDGTPAEDFKPDPLSGIVNIAHVYTYAQGMSKYTGHQFYPAFEVIGQDGTSYGKFNVDGKFVAIEVQGKV